MFFLTFVTLHEVLQHIQHCVLWGCSEKSVLEMDVGSRVTLTIGIPGKLATTICILLDCKYCKA
jgi:hypothetical protein